MSLKQIKRLLLGIGFLLSSGIFPAYAAETEEVDVHVSILATKSLSINATTYDYGALNVAASSVTAIPIIVTNNSTALIETYTLSATNAISDTGGVDWTLASSTGTNQFAMGAQFSDNRPADTNAAWDQDDLSLTTDVCTNDIFGNGSSTESGLDVMPAGTRNLWFRIRTPSSVTDGDQHTVTVTLSVF